MSDKWFRYDANDDDNDDHDGCDDDTVVLVVTVTVVNHKILPSPTPFSHSTQARLTSRQTNGHKHSDERKLAANYCLMDRNEHDVL